MYHCFIQIFLLFVYSTVHQPYYVVLSNTNETKHGKNTINQIEYVPSVGAGVGSSVGAGVGSSVGAGVGSSVGPGVGSSVGAGVGSIFITNKTFIM